MTQIQKLQIFSDLNVRAVWDSEKEEWYFSVVDVCGILTDSADPSNYWRVLKTRLKKEGVETATICSRLKLTASDGKQRLTDVATIEQMIRLVQSIPSPKADPFKQWMAQVAKSARTELEKRLGRSVISSEKASDYLSEFKPEKNCLPISKIKPVNKVHFKPRLVPKR